MAITTSRQLETQGDVDRIPGVLAASTTFYSGQLVVIDGGFLANPTNAAGKLPLGILDRQSFAPGANSLTTPASGMPTGVVLRGRVWVPFTGAAQTDVGVLFYLADNGDVTKTAGSKTIAVYCVGFKAGHVLLDFNAPIRVA